jgi:hypothetical protein
MKRYDMEYVPGHMGDEMKETEDGDWVRWEDVREKLEEALELVEDWELRGTIRFMFNLDNVRVK